MNKVSTGREFEDVVCSYLWERGYDILEGNYYTRVGEIDIVAVQKREIVFVEVRGMVANSYYQKSIYQLLTRPKLRKLTRTIDWWLVNQGSEVSEYRLDFVGVEVDRKNKHFVITHVKNL